jgi:hypothetical protein
MQGTLVRWQVEGERIANRKDTCIQSKDFSNSTWTTYRLFGLTLASNFRLVKRVALLANSAHNLTFTCTVVESVPGDWTGVPPTYISPYKTKNGESMLHVYHQPTCDVLHFTDVADFYVWPDRIICYQLQRASRYQVEMWLVGTVLALWLEREAIPVLHASAVVVEDRAVAFLASNTAGKSTLAAALMQCGYPLLTDDALPIKCYNNNCIGQPGYPQLRLWPDQAAHFLGHFENPELVHLEASKQIVPVGPGFGDFCDVPQPLGCLYIPIRRDPEVGGTEIEITPVSLRDATIELVRYSFLNRVLAALGLQPGRLDYLVQIAKQVPMRRIIYPSGLKHLPRVCEKLLEDVKALPY